MEICLIDSPQLYQKIKKQHYYITELDNLYTFKTIGISYIYKKENVTLNIAQPDVFVPFATTIVPPPFSAQRYLPTVTDLN